MRSRVPSLLVATALLAPLTTSLQGQAPALPGALHGTLTIHLILHAVGQEQYDIVPNADGTRTLTTNFTYTDRNNTRTTTATLTTSADERPLKLEVKSGTAVATTLVADGQTTT